MECRIGIISFPRLGIYVGLVIDNSKGHMVWARLGNIGIFRRTLGMPVAAYHFTIFPQSVYWLSVILPLSGYTYCLAKSTMLTKHCRGEGSFTAGVFAVDQFM